MTMDNGEGRPLDEDETGNEDPQGWYFDLPGGAWERQEEKNRMLRQRVLGNIEEDAEKAKGDPFSKKFELRPQQEPKFELRRPEPEQPKKRGLFGFGKKKSEDPVTPEPPRGLELHETDEDWNTEPPLKLSPFPRPAAESARAPWAESGGGWDLGEGREATPPEEDEASTPEDFASGIRAWAHGEAPAAPAHEAPTEVTRDDDGDFASGIRAWAHDEAPAAPAHEAPTEDTREDDDGDFASGIRAWAHGEAPAAPAHEAPTEVTRDDDGDFASGIRAWAHGEAPAAPAHEAPTEVTRDDDDDFASGIRAWAHGGPEHVPTGQTSFTHEDAADDPPAEDWGASNTSREEAGSLPGDSLRLRPRAHQDDEKHLDWNFGPAAWGEKEEQAPAEVESLEDDEGALESMRKWAERSREQDHPHFTTAAHPQDEAEAPLPPPIPLRPRHHDDADQPAAHHPSTPVAGPGELEPPQALPIRLRSRTEPPEERPRREATEGPSKWDDFFNLKRDDDAPAGTSDEEDDIAAAEGLAAMREWASKRPEPDAPVDIPEEFLKPFDWELQEEVPEAPAEFRKPFDWEDTTPDAADATGAGATEEWSDTVEDDETASFREPLPFPARPVLEEAAVSPAVPELEDEDDDPLAGLFDQAPATPAPPKKKGRFGRLFGRGKDKAAPEPVLEDTGEPGDWVLPGEDQQDDVRTVAAAEWLEDAGSAAPDPTEDAPDAGVAGWGAALAASQATLDEEVADFSAALTAREGDPEATAEFEVPDFDLEPAATEEAAPEVLWAPQLPTFADPVEVSPPADETGAASHPAEEAAATREASSDEAWDPEPVTFEVNVAPWEATEDTEPETPAPVEAVASVEEPSEPAWWEATEDTEPETPAPVEAVASVEEPSEPAWWEATEDTEPETPAPVEAVASVEESLEPASPWWEASEDTEPETPAPVEAVASVEERSEPAAPWWEAGEDSEPEAPAPVEAVASVEESPEPSAPWWEATEDTEPEAPAPVEAVASVEESPEPASPWWEATEDSEPEAPAPVEAAASVEESPEPASPWWEATEDTEPETPAPVEAVASVEESLEPASPWWEAGEDTEPETPAPVEAVASVEEPSEPAWWEATEDTEPETPAPVEAVASVEESPEPASPSWEASEDSEPEAPAPVEAVASVEESPEPSAWWEASEDTEPEAPAPVEAVASVEESPGPASPWWEASEETEPEAPVPVEAVASVEESPEPSAPWWEASEETEPDAPAPVEAVASVEESPGPEQPWWEASEETEPEAPAPVEAVASVEESPEPASPWWEASEETEPDAPAPVEAVASVEESPEPEQPAAAGWQEAVTGAPAPGVAAASFEAPTPASYDDDDPWADFVARPAASVPEPPPLPPAWGATPAAPRDEDMWGDIAATAEQAAHSSPDIDLAASLESQMAEQSEPAFGWAQRGPDRDERSWDAAPAIEAAPPSPSEEEDVILAAFERHAATPESPEARREQDEAFAELLGEQAADIVSEVSEEDTGRSFIRMTGWAPQRSASDFDGGWAPQQEVEETLARNQRPFNFGGIDGDAFAPPSWAVDEMEPDEVPASARRGHRTRTWIREIVETGLLAFLVFLSVRASFQNFKVEGSSMYPTLEDGQFLIVNKLVYSEVDLDKLGKFVPFVDGGNDPERNVFHGPERGDIVVLIDPRNPETDLIKRVIGLPGETVEIVDGKVYINDRLLEEPYIKSEWHDTRPKITVPPDEYFVMGDNRDNSLDSRNSQVSTVPKDLIIGKAMLSYWPSSKFGFAPNASPDLTDDKPVLTSKRIGDD